MSDDAEYEIGAVPAAIFTDGLDFDQEVTLQVISECLSRGENYLKEMVAGNEELRHQFEPLHRVLSGISYGSIVPIMQGITEGKDPGSAVRSVIAGVGGLMFFGGIEYAKAMGLHGVGVSIPEKTYATDEYPEQKPFGNATTDDLAALLNASFGDSSDEED